MIFHGRKTQVRQLFGPTVCKILCYGLEKKHVINPFIQSAGGNRSAVGLPLLYFNLPLGGMPPYPFWNHGDAAQAFEPIIRSGICMREYGSGICMAIIIRCRNHAGKGNGFKAVPPFHWTASRFDGRSTEEEELDSLEWTTILLAWSPICLWCLANSWVSNK